MVDAFLTHHPFGHYGLRSESNLTVPTTASIMAGEASPEGIIELLKIKLPFCMKLVTAHMAGCTTAVLCFLALCLVSSRRVRRQAVFVLVTIAVCLAFGSAALGISAAAYEIDLHLRYDTEQPEEWYRTKQLSGASVSMAACECAVAA